MADEVIQGKWDDLVHRRDLHGRNVRIQIIEDEATGNPWIKLLRTWADRSQTAQRPVDDSRESIYSGTVDDPR